MSTLSPKDLLEGELDVPRWSIPNLAIRDHVSILFGTAGSGKTTLYREAIAANAAGRKFLGLFDFDEPQRLLVFDWENSEAQVRLGLRRLGLGPESEYTDNFGYLIPPRGLNLDTPEGRREVGLVASDFGATCLIFDNRDTAFPNTNELDGQRVEGALQATKELALGLGVAVLVISHEPKAQYPDSVARLRGHSNWGNFTDQMFRYIQRSESSRLEHAKNRGMSRRQSVEVRFTEEGERDTGPMRLTALLLDPKDKKKKNRKAEDVATVEALLDDSDQPLTWGKLQEETGWPTNRLREALKASQRVQQPRRGQYETLPSPEVTNELSARAQGLNARATETNPRAQKSTAA